MIYLKQTFKSVIIYLTINNRNTLKQLSIFSHSMILKIISHIKYSNISIQL